MYVLTTASLLAYTSPANIDLAAPVQQAMNAGLGKGTFGSLLTSLSVALFSYAATASEVIFVGMVSRLPMVAGWDGLLPKWWSELHPRFRTPSKAIGAICVSMILMAVFSLWGAGNQEAVQALTGAATAGLCVMYALLFATVLFGFRRAPEPPGLTIRLGALAALLVALVSFVLQIVPLGEVPRPAVFAVKVGALIVLTNGLGAYLYWNGAKKLRAGRSGSLTSRPVPN
jgi:amino acid transporter